MTGGHVTEFSKKNFVLETDSVGAGAAASIGLGDERTSMKDKRAQVKCNGQKIFLKFRWLLKLVIRQQVFGLGAEVMWPSVEPGQGSPRQA